MKLKWKDVYSKCNHIENSQVTNILKTYSLRSNIKNFFKNYGVWIFVIFVLCLALLCYTFLSNLMIVLYCLILFVLLFLFAVVYATYTIKLGEEKIDVKVNFQNIEIPYSKLANIYLVKKKKRIFFIPYYYYALNIIYAEDEENINILSFPTVMLNKNEAINFFACFETEEFEVQNEK